MPAKLMDMQPKPVTVRITLAVSIGCHVVMTRTYSADELVVNSLGRGSLFIPNGPDMSSAHIMQVERVNGVLTRLYGVLRCRNPKKMEILSRQFREAGYTQAEEKYDILLTG
jgi:hypothetical protein